MIFFSNNILLFMPQLMIIVFALSTIFALILIRIKNGNWDLSQYFSNYTGSSYSIRTSVDLMFSVLVMIGKGLFFLLFVCLLAVFIYAFSGKEIIEYINKLRKFIPEEMLQWVSLIITLAAILAAFKKDYYLVFSIEEVLDRYKFKSKIFTIVNIMLITRIILMFEPLQTKDLHKFIFNFIYLVLYIVALMLGCYLIYLVMNLLYSREQSELDLLDKLYYKIRNRTFYFEKSYINITGIILNGEYLFDQYIRNYIRIKNYHICKIKFESVYNECKDEAYKKIKNSISIKGSIFLIVIYLLYVIKVIVLSNISKCFKYSDDIKGVLISIVTWGLCILGLNYINGSIYTNNIKQLMNRMFLSDHVYTYESKTGKKYLTSISSFGTGKINSKYFISILNMAVYFKMILNGSETEDVHKFVQYIEDIYNEPKYNDLCKDEIFYIINIYFAFLRYVSCDEINKDEIIRNVKTKQWSKIIKKRRVQGLMKAIIGNTKNLYNDDGIREWSNFTVRIKSNKAVL